ncbi:MAG: NADH-quinone oxidoreductase subunit NuoG [Pseudomonadota bacterium]
MPTINIDGVDHEFEDGLALIQACETAGVEIPRFCYHERLSIAGNCRMCLVEVVGAPKPVASCAMSVNDLRPGPEGQPPQIRTNSQDVKKAREGCMEFLLINHPLDCPICDQGGECDLQDQAMAFGVDTSRFDENKRAVENKDIGPLVKTIMTRCIHCTRCVRYMTEVAGVEELGATGRGENVEITTYLEKNLTSEMQGNVIDLCPVGALTSKPYAFQARPWELDKTESIDVMDAVGSAIRVDSRGREVLRVMPRINEAVNEEWISDKTRFIWDGLKARRLDRPYVRRDGVLSSVGWDDALAVVAERLRETSADRIGAIAGDLAGCEEIFALKDLLIRFGVRNLDCRQDGAALDPTLGRSSYLFNATIEGIEDADAIILIGTNPRHEAPVLNARIRRRFLAGASIGVVGEPADLTYGYTHLGDGPQALVDIMDGGDVADALRAANRPLIIVGQGALARPDGRQVLRAAAALAQYCGAIAEDWNGLSILHTAAARVGALDLGFVPSEGGLAASEMAHGSNLDLLFLLGADEIPVHKSADTFVVYQGSHGDAGAQVADVILPGAAYTEKSATYVNTEGRVQQSRRAIFPPGEAREDWKIIRALSAAAGSTLGYDDLAGLRAAMYEVAPWLAGVGGIEAGTVADTEALAGSGALSSEPFRNVISDFYMTNPIARASDIMRELTAARLAQSGGALRDAAE